MSIETESWSQRRLDQMKLEIQHLLECNKNLEQRLARLEPPQAPATRYRDVTAECVLDEGPTCIIRHQQREVRVRDGYRLRKIALMYSNQPEFAFIIEQRQP